MVIKSKSKSKSSSRGDGSMKEEEVVHYKGVRMRRWGSWVSEIRAPNQKTRIWLGSYSTQEAAARAYDAALLCLKGSSASFNFPHHHLHLHVPPTPHLSAKSIQRLAAAAAAAANANTTSTTTTTTLPPSPSVASPAISSDTSGCCTAASPAAAAPEEDECVDIDSWFDSAFQSHKFMMELMVLGGGGCGGVFFDPQPLPQVVEECFDDVGDIRLWSFY